MSEPRPTKAALKKAEAEQFAARVRATLERAHAAAAQAAGDYVKTARMSAEGLVIDSCGGASVVVYKPSYRLRKTLETLGEIERGYRGA